MIQNNLFLTQPLVLHASLFGIKGEVLEFWEKTKKFATKNPKTKLRTAPNITIITWNNLEKGCFELSCEHQGVDYVVLGKEVQKWSHYYKLQSTIDLINLLETEYVLACDSHDALLLKQPEDILNKFLKFNCDVVYGGECRFYPDLKNPVTNKWKTFQSKIAKSKFCYLSAGTYIGKKETIKEFLTACNKIRPYNLFDCLQYKTYPGGKEIGCDQSTMQHTFPSFYPRIQIDYKCEIFQNLAYNHPNDVGYAPIPII